MNAGPISLVSTLIEAGNVDTVYRELYLGRAQTLLSPLMSLEDFHSSDQQQAMLAELPLAVARALDKGDWPLVKELSQRTDAPCWAHFDGYLIRTVEDRLRLQALEET